MRVGSQGTTPGTAGSGQLPQTKGGEAGKGSSKSAPDKTGQKAPSKDVLGKDVFETAPRQAPRDLFGQAPRLTLQPAVILPPGGMKNVDGKNPNIDPSATRKPGVSLQDVHALLVSRERLNRALTDGRVPDEDFMDRMEERDRMDGALATIDPAFVQKARTEGGQHSPVAGGRVTIIPIDNLGGPGLTTGGGGSGIGPRPGQGGTLLQPGQGGGGAGGGTLTPGGLGFGGDVGGGVHPPNQKSNDGGGVHPPNRKGNDGGKVSPTANTNHADDAGLRGREKDTAPETTNDGTDAGNTKSTKDPEDKYKLDSKTKAGEGLPQPDESGRGKGGDDVGPRGVPEPARITNLERDLIGPLIGTTTGPDDKERPNIGGTSGSVSTNPSESRADDVGGRNMPGRTGGGTIDVNIGEVLLKELGLWDRPGGPDPVK